MNYLKGPFLLLPQIVLFKGPGLQNTYGLILLVYQAEYFPQFSFSEFLK